jgi:hypothetical protein
MVCGPRPTCGSLDQEIGLLICRVDDTVASCPALIFILVSSELILSALARVTAGRVMTASRNAIEQREYYLGIR